MAQPRKLPRSAAFVADGFLRSTALSPIGADADLLAVCAEFRASEVAFSAIYDDPDAGDETCDALANPIASSWDGILNRMAQLRATTSDGLAARALALAQHSGIKAGTGRYPFAFKPDEPAGGITGRLLHMLLVDAVAMCGTPPPNPDADLLSLRAELHAVASSLLAIDSATDVSDEELDNAINRLDDICRAIVDSAPAQTSEGIALKAAAAMHRLRACFDCDSEKDWPGSGEEMAWHVLSELAGDAYTPSASGRAEPPRRTPQSPAHEVVK